MSNLILPNRIISFLQYGRKREGKAMLKLQKDLRDELKDEYLSYMSSTVAIAMTIAYYAHRDAVRVNNEQYITHPMAIAEHFKNLTMIEEDVFVEEDLYKFDLFHQGIQEVCWLHDVIEDTPYTLEDIRDVFDSVRLAEYFDQWISKPLELITHDKSEPYPIYIGKVIEHPTSALVKLLDLHNNSNAFTLDKLGEKELKRIQDYVGYMKVINDKYHFIEKFNAYLDYMSYKIYQKNKEE